MTAIPIIVVALGMVLKGFEKLEEFKTMKNRGNAIYSIVNIC